MSLILDGSNGVTFPVGGNPQAAPAGVIQVVQATTNSGTTISVNTYTSISGLTASITPKFSTSKILVSFSCPFYVQGSANGGGFAIYKNGSLLLNPNTSDGTGPFTFYQGSGGSVGALVSYQYLDSPATTSSTTYAIYARPYFASTGNMYINQGTGTPTNYGTATITLMEIAQ